MLVDLKSFDFEFGIVQKIDAIFYILYFQQYIALYILVSAEDLARKILLFGISEDFSDHIFIQLFLEIVKTTY